MRQQPDGWLAAQVPGEIHLDFMRAGQMPEPTVGTNMPECRWPETKSWWYRRTFEVDADFVAHERQALVFDGLDLYAQVFVNGQLAGEAANAFVPATLRCQAPAPRGRERAGGAADRWQRAGQGHGGAAQPGAALEPQPGGPGEVPNPMSAGDITGHRMWSGRKWLRKPQFTYGWDWVDALPNIGIWRSVRLEGRTQAALHDLRLDTLLDGRVRLELAALVDNLHPWASAAVSC